jgi:hypothetical protein
MLFAPIGFISRIRAKKRPMANYAIGQVIYAGRRIHRGEGENRVSPDRQSRSPEHKGLQLKVMPIA